MKIAIQIPIKSRSSERIQNKNFKIISGKPLSYWLLDQVVTYLPSNWDIYIDSESDKYFDIIEERYPKKFKYFIRDIWFSTNEANGNHLITHFANNNICYDIYVQLFVTAVNLPGYIIKEAIDYLIINNSKYDSLFTVTEETGWYWKNGKSINYDYSVPNGLPRSQDAPIYKETTGLYAITKESLLKNSCRIGKTPYLFKINSLYSIDIDTIDDFNKAEKILSNKNEI